MRPESIARIRDGFAFDTETWVVESGVPPMVCCAFYRDGQGDVLGGDHAGKLKALEWYLGLLRGGHTLIALNGPFDHSVMAKAAKDLLGIDIVPEIFRAYAREQCVDIAIWEQLHALAEGHLGYDPRTFRETYYSLDDTVSMVLDRTDAKANDKWRMRYRELDGLPIEFWPLEARTYPIDDVRNTWDVAQVQVGRNKNTHDLQNQQYTDWCLRLGAIHGLTVDPEEMDRLWNRVESERAEKRGSLLALRLLKMDGEEVKKNEPLIKRRVALAFGVSGECKTCSPWSNIYAQWVGRQRDREAALVEKGRRDRVTTDLPDFRGGRVPGLEKCRGFRTSAISEKTGKPVKAWSGCMGEACPACQGSGKVTKTRGCACKGKAPTCAICTGTGKEIASWRGCPDCSTTGLDLSSGPYPTTDTGGVAKGRDALNESGDEDLIEFAHYDETAKVGSTYLPWLRKGIDEDGNVRPLTLRPRVLKETGRAGYADVVHQLPRGLGVRECIVARPRRVLISCDWTGAELITHAQSCLWIVGESKMAEALLAGIKVHDELGARIGGVTYEHMIANRKTVKALGDYRQSAKPANFGFPGMMSAPTLAIQQRVQGPDTTGPDGRKYKGLRFCILAGGEVECGREKITKWGRREITPVCKRCVEVAEEIHQTWLKTWPENVAYFEFIKAVHRTGSMIQHVTKRVRSGMSACATANGYFQGLAGDAMKLAIQRMSWEMYVQEDSPLFGVSQLILPVHDEAIVEADEEHFRPVAKRVSEIMVGALSDCCPDLAPAVEAEAGAMRRWYKGAEPVYNEAGELEIWQPRK